MKREHLQQTYQRDEAAQQRALAALRTRLASGQTGHPDPLADAPEGPDLPEAEDEVVAEIRPK
jgi:hypothetical protein